MAPRAEHPIAAAACAVGDVKIDRGGALYLTRDPEKRAAFEAAGFEAAARGDLLALLPGARLCAAFDEWAHARGADDRLLLARLNHQAASRDAQALFVEGLKRWALHAPASYWEGYEKSLRRLAARALRTGAEGGGLWRCYALLWLIKEDLQ